MSVEQPDITDPVDVARLAFSAEDGVIQGDLTWQSYVDTDDEGTITVDVYLDRNPMGPAPSAGSATASCTSARLRTPTTRQPNPRTKSGQPSPSSSRPTWGRRSTEEILGGFG
jgi:hypothetical protein